MHVNQQIRRKKRNGKRGAAGLLAGALGLLACLLGTGCAAEGGFRPDPGGPALPAVSLTEAGSSGAEESSLQREQLYGKTVILDPGHGFGDPGCPFPGSTLCERDVTPVLVSKIRAELEADGVTVLQTHDGVTYPSVSELEQLAQTLSYDLDGYLSELVGAYSGRDPAGQQDTLAAFREGLSDNGLYGIFERSYYANLLSVQQPSSLYISVHVNANADSSALSGFDLFCCSDTPYAEQSSEAMRALEAVLRNRFPQTELRGTSYGWEVAYAVNKYPDMPSLLIESGYATNPTDAANLLDEDWQNAFARAVADGIEAFLRAL